MNETFNLDSTVTIRRETGLMFGVLRSHGGYIRIRVDGVEVAKLGRNDHACVRVVHGHHKVVALIGANGGSPELPITVPHDSDLEIIVKRGLRATSTYDPKLALMLVLAADTQQSTQRMQSGFHLSWRLIAVSLAALGFFVTNLARGSHAYTLSWFLLTGFSAVCGAGAFASVWQWYKARSTPSE